MSREQPSTADVRPIEDVIEDLQKLLMRQLPTMNRNILANWGTFCEAAEMYRFNHRIITDPKWQSEDTPFIWIRHGEHTAAQHILRKLADNLDVPNMIYDLEDKKK